MTDLSRRAFLRRGAAGLAAAAGVGGLVLRAGAGPTESSGGLGQYEDYLKQEGSEAVPVPEGLKPPAAFGPTDDNILGPYYRKGAPVPGQGDAAVGGRDGAAGGRAGVGPRHPPAAGRQRR